MNLVTVIVATVIRYHGAGQIPEIPRFGSTRTTRFTIRETYVYVPCHCVTSWRRVDVTPVGRRCRNVSTCRRARDADNGGFRSSKISSGPQHDDVDVFGLDRVCRSTRVCRFGLDVRCVANLDPCSQYSCNLSSNACKISNSRLFISVPMLALASSCCTRHQSVPIDRSAICSKEVLKAFSVCSRDIFMPEDQKSEAFDDQPVRLDRDFNISAPRTFPPVLLPRECPSSNLVPFSALDGRGISPLHARGIPPVGRVRAVWDFFIFFPVRF